MRMFLWQFQISPQRHIVAIAEERKCVNVSFLSLQLESDSSFFLMLKWIMPVRVDITPPPPANSKQPGITKSLLYNGSKFKGYQKSKGNSYDVEVVLQVRSLDDDKRLCNVVIFGWLSILCVSFILRLL